jgi:hypothetical protein
MAKKLLIKNEVIMEFNYENIKKTYYENIFNISSIEENIHMMFYSVLAFFIPFILGHPQILVGSIVNCALILGATYLKGHKLLPVILLPSLGVMTVGLMFGTYTLFLLYLVPFIWAGNAIFSYGYRFLHFKTKKYYLSIPISAALKTGFLFVSALILVSLNVIPPVFLAAMGIFQLYTSLIGGAAALAIIKTREKIVGSKA